MCTPFKCIFDQAQIRIAINYLSLSAQDRVWLLLYYNAGEGAGAADIWHLARMLKMKREIEMIKKSNLSSFARKGRAGQDIKNYGHCLVYLKSSEQRSIQQLLTHTCSKQIFDNTISYGEQFSKICFSINYNSTYIFNCMLL